MRQKILFSLCMICSFSGNLIAMQDISQHESNNNNHSSTMILMSEVERSDNIIAIESIQSDALRDMINLWIQASNRNTPESIIGAFQLMLAHSLKVADDSLGIATESAGTNSEKLEEARLILGDTGALSSNVLEIVKTIIVALKSDLSYEKKVQSIVGEFMDLLLTTSNVVGNHIADDKKAILTQVANTIGVVGNINNAGTLNSIWEKLFSCCCKNKKV